MDDQFIDAFDDDSDLLDNREDTNDSIFCSNPDHNHGSMADIPEDIRALPRLIPFLELTKLVNELALKDSTKNVEQEAIVYSLIELIGEEKLKYYTEAARARQRAKVWGYMLEVFEDIIESDIFTSLKNHDDISPTLVMIMETNLRTSIDLARMNMQRHIDTLNEKYPEYNVSLVDGLYSFSGFETIAKKFATELKARVTLILDLVDGILNDRSPQTI